MADGQAKAAEVLAFLAASTFFGGFPRDVLAWLVAVGVERARPKGYLLLEQDAPGDSLIVILSGRAKAVRTAADGREVVLNFLGPGDVVGEIGALDGGPRSAGVEVIEAGRFFTLQRRDLIPALLERPEALVELVQVLCTKLRSASDALETQSREMKGRFAAGLLRLAELHGQHTARGIAVDTGASQADLGSYLGLSRTNTSRLIAELSRLGAVGTEGRVLIIHDMGHLEALALDAPA